MIGIVGAGLSGLLLGYRLQQAGKAFKILEARNRIGGRIHTLIADETPLEMGATWFAPKHEFLWRLLKELGLAPYQQRMQNTFLYQQKLHAAVQKVALPSQEPSYRVAGGTSQIIQALAKSINTADILLEQAVNTIEIAEHEMKVATDKEEFEFEKLVWAAPPKLFAEQILITPDLSQDLREVMQQTHTWMEDSIKLAVTYQTPFWQEKGLPTTLFSNGGPIIEFYDHSDRDNAHFALCGFMHPQFNHTNAATRKEAVIQQLQEVFGEEGVRFTGYHETVWQQEDFTGNKKPIGLVPHQNNGHPIYQEPVIEKLYFANTETSPHYGGYMEGAVYVAEYLADILKN